MLSTYLWLTIASLVIFLAYNIWIICKYGVPPTLSDTFYLLQETKNGLGYLFTAMMFTISMLLIPGWLEVSEVISSWSKYLLILPFITIGGLCFVGAAPLFRSSGAEPVVHETAAKIAAVAALIWCLVVCWKIMYIPLAVMAVVALIATFTKTWKSGFVYWSEMLCFYPTFATVIAEEIINL